MSGIDLDVLSLEVDFSAVVNAGVTFKECKDAALDVVILAQGDSLGYKSQDGNRVIIKLKAGGKTAADDVIRSLKDLLNLEAMPTLTKRVGALDTVYETPDRPAKGITSGYFDVKVH